MNRRSALGWLSAIVGAVTSGIGFRSAAQPAAAHPPANAQQAEWERKAAEMRAASIAAIPYSRVETNGADALATWERLRAEGRGWPVVVGGDEDLARAAEQLGIADKTAPADVLAAAAKLTHPAALRALRAREREQGAEAARQWAARPDSRLPQMINVGADGAQRTLSPAEVRSRMLAEADAGEPPLGDWPAAPAPNAPPLSVARDLDSKPLDKVHILLLPTAESAAAPAYLKWGGWNACPAPEYHVAALRSWHERYGAEVIGMSGDFINLRVRRRRPASGDEALALAREQFVYCEDIVLQGTEALPPLAAGLMADYWWFFWWD